MSASREEWRSDCPINICLEIFGDRWTLLIVRDLMLKGRSRFGELLQGGESIASNILTDRLAKLEQYDIVEKRRDPRDARRSTYRLTRRGIDLLPVLFEMILWAAQHEKTAAPAAEIKAMKKDRAAYLLKIRRAWEGAGVQ